MKKIYIPQPIVDMISGKEYRCHIEDWKIYSKEVLTEWMTVKLSDKFNKETHMFSSMNMEDLELLILEGFMEIHNNIDVEPGYLCLILEALNDPYAKAIMKKGGKDLLCEALHIKEPVTFDIDYVETPTKQLGVHITVDDSQCDDFQFYTITTEDLICLISKLTWLPIRSRDRDAYTSNKEVMCLCRAMEVDDQEGDDAAAKIERLRDEYYEYFRRTTGPAPPKMRDEITGEEIK